MLGNAQGFVHSSIPLAGATVEALGSKLKTWTTTTTYNPADINAENLKQYDAIFLASTTGCFLDAMTGQPVPSRAEIETRRAALLDFVRSGKGLAGVHAATDSYLAELPSLRLNDVSIAPDLVRQNERMLTGGFYAEVELAYVANPGGGHPFGVISIRPIQLSTRHAVVRADIGPRSGIAGISGRVMAAWPMPRKAVAVPKRSATSQIASPPSPQKCG